MLLLPGLLAPGLLEAPEPSSEVLVPLVLDPDESLPPMAELPLTPKWE